MEYKKCVRCKEKKPVSKFSLRHRNDDRYKKKDYYFSACKDCEKEYMRESKKNSYSGSPECTREHNLRKYGITTEQYDTMLTEQGNVCKICKSPTAGGRGRFHVDHDHRTGEIRGLLCHRCNTALGLTNEDTSILSKMIHYINAGDLYGSHVQ